MERERQWTVTLKLNVWVCLALFPLFLTYANSKLDKPAGRENTVDNHPDFISIDCGANADYVDTVTGIWYQTDKDFVETGTNHELSSTTNSHLPYVGTQLQTLRYFPDGDRNCYTLKPKQGANNRYFIRAFFEYGNYDLKNQTPSFHLHIGVNYWDTVDWHDPNEPYHYTEVIHTPRADTIDVCLVKTGPTIPFISTLELRLLNSSIYQNQIMSSGTPPLLLYRQYRIDIDAPLDHVHSRYKDDVYDRLWHNYNGSDWFSLIPNQSIDLDPVTTGDAYKLPAEVLRSACQTMNISQALEFDADSVWPGSVNKSSEYYVYFHFVETEKLPPGKKRIINITLKSESILSQPLVLEYLKPVSIQNATQGSVRFSISATSESDAPPMLNAFEVYRLLKQLSSPTDTGDVGAILDIKSTYRISRLNWQGDPCVPNQYAWEGLNCSYEANPRITSLNLSTSKLTGKIITSFSLLTDLEFLDLSNNELEGPLPEFLANLPKLKTLNLTGNKLSGPIPKALKQKADTNLQLSVDGNPNLCISSSCHKKNKVVIPLVAAFVGAFIISAALLFIFRRLQVLIIKNKLRYSKKTECVDSKKQEFTYSEVECITNNFERVVGKGGFGTVYHGCIGEKQVAVKMLSPSSHQGYKQFQTEAKILTRVHHKCLTPLIGYCDEDNRTALIYEYMPNGNLSEHLSEKNQNLLGWKQRLQIALDSAVGLEYMHKGCYPPIVHRDVKTSNILLSENFRGRISDFGLSKIFSDECDTHVTTIIGGTRGYLDPEYCRTNKLNVKSDVFSFGVVLLEIITGQHAILKTHENTHIIQWVSSMLATGEIDSIMDSRLQGGYDAEGARKVLDVAMACVAQSSVNRPTMNQVVIELQRCLPTDNLDINSGIRTISGESSLLR